MLTHAVPLGVGEAFFGEGIGPIMLDELNCEGRESHVSYCSLTGNSSFCKHSEDVGVFCKGKVECKHSCRVSVKTCTLFSGGMENCSDSDVRLLGRQDKRGVFQICYEGLWGSMCDTRINYGIEQNYRSANVICRQLGFLEPNTSE